jgi:hypothetical protein
LVVLVVVVAVFPPPPAPALWDTVSFLLHMLIRVPTEVLEAVAEWLEAELPCLAA